MIKSPPSTSGLSSSVGMLQSGSSTGGFSPLLYLQVLQLPAIPALVHVFHPQKASTQHLLMVTVPLCPAASHKDYYEELGCPQMIQENISIQNYQLSLIFTVSFAMQGDIFIALGIRRVTLGRGWGE